MSFPTTQWSLLAQASWDGGIESRKALETRLAEHRSRLEALEKEHEINLAILEEERKTRGDDPYIARLERENRELLAQIEQLRGDTTQLAAIDDRLSL